MNNPTPGPWHYHKSVNAHDQGLIISETTGANVAVVYNGEADTALLAAAPEMYAALKAACDFAYDHVAGYSVKEGKEAARVYNLCLSALRKAEGDN